MKKYIITEEVLNSIIIYLLSRPMQEVERGVFLLRNLEEVKEEDGNTSI